MSAASPTRPSRRAAASRRQVVDSSDEDEEAAQHAPENADDDEDDEEEFTPAPSRTARNQSRRKTGDVPTTPRKRRVTKSRESVEPSVLLSPAQSTATMTTAAEEESVLSSSPTKKTSPQKRRRSVRSGGRQSRASLAAPELESPPPVPPMPVLLPTPKPSTSPEPSLQPNPAGTPLADITQAVVNEVAPADEAQDNVTKLPIRFAAPEKPLMKPMDIVVRKRPSMMPMVQEQSGPKTRIVITYLVLTNFKSYAGRQEVGPFHASFSSVVGPNGSGKSNVIDSLLFVFGFRASKMRQGKISALIHNSAGHPNLDHCEVEVHFQEVLDLPAGGHEVVPDSTLVISRKAFKNNSSKYYINARESNFTTVTTLLRDRGVDLDHKRFLILQGEVESIAQMKPKAASEHDDGLLEYLEDIIGTSKYKTPIEEAAAETEALNEVCMEKSNRVQHVEREKNGLEDKKNKALAFIRDENELVRKQAALYQICTQECSDSIQVTGEAVERTQKDLDEELRNHEGSEEVIKQLQKKYKANAKEFESIEKQTQSVLKELAKMDRETVKFEEKKKFLVGKQKKLEKSLQASKFASSEAETSIKQCTADVERNVAQISELEKTMHVEEKELAAIRDSLKGKTQGLSDQIASKQKELEPWQEKINEKQAAIAVAQSELDILREKDNAGAVAVTEVKAKIEGLEEAKKSKTSELTECKVQKKEVEKDVQRVTKEMEELAKQEPGIRSKLSGARQKADEARSSLSATQTQGNVLTGLMRLKESGRIDGFHGRLGNLGAIDSQYDVAISTACPSLDNLVVDSVEVGQQCIDYLRKNNLGRANFILLDRLAQRDLSAIETPENVPRLFDLVKSKHEKFGPAFYSVLQNTLVARDLEQANRIAYGAKRWRVVTLDGQLIDKSGTMSGGGTRVARGGMSSKIAADVTKEQVAKLEVDRDELEKALEQIQQQLRELESSLKKLQEETPRLDTKAQKIALELESYDRNIADCQRRIQELSTEQQPSKSDKGRKATLEKTISTLEKELSRLNAETVGIEEEIKAHQDKIMEIGGVKLRGQKAKVDGLKEQIDTLNNEMSTAEVAMAKAEKQKIKHEKAQVDAAGELEGISADLERVATEMTSQTKDASGSKRQAEEAQEVSDHFSNASNLPNVGCVGSRDEERRAAGSESGTRLKDC